MVKSYTSNGLNQYLTAGSANPTYDNNGNLDWDGTRNHAYDIENKLASTLNGGPGTALNYDPLNRLDTYNNGTTTRFIYDGDEVVAQLDSSGSILRREIRGDGPDEVLVEYNPTDYRFYYADERGSTIATADPNGNRTSVDTYDEFGNPSNNSNPPIFKYTGQMWLPDAGVYYYKARDYSPSLGTFAQTDPAGYADSANLYAYVLNDPINLSDPTGLAQGVPGATLHCAQNYYLDSATQTCQPVGPPIYVTYFNPFLLVGGIAWTSGTIDVLRTSGLPIDNGVRDESCKSPPVTPREQQLVKEGEVDSFWKSRLSRGDPFASTALAVVENRGAYGALANGTLAAAIRNQYGAIPTELIRGAMHNISLSIAQAHINTIVTYGSATAAQIAQYHYQVFSEYGLPASTFEGGSTIGRAEFSNHLLGWSGCGR